MTADPSPAVPSTHGLPPTLRGKIRDGTYGPGAYLPSRNEITALYGVSAITARDALAVISREDYATAVRGRGHIVRRKRSRLSLPSRPSRSTSAGSPASSIRPGTPCATPTRPPHGPRPSSASLAVPSPRSCSAPVPGASTPGKPELFASLPARPCSSPTPPRHWRRVADDLAPPTRLRYI